MKKITLNGCWQLDGAGFACAGEIPGSVLSVLLENNLIDDPYYRDNELKTLALLDHDFDFWRTFDYQPDGNRVLLHCDGLDTLCDIYVNDTHIGYTDNMHRTYEFDVTDRLVAGKNRIRITFHSVDKYLKANDPFKPTLGVGHSLKGYGNLRKAICMSGWDWAARLPDVGIWRDIYLLVVDSARLTDFRITQRHENGKVFLKPTLCFDGEAEATVTLTAPDGDKTELEIGKENEIENPQLWWPNGLGEHPLYRVEAILSQNGFIVDRSVKKVGLRTLTLIR
ncbi:MAG: glycoside hydrolase family 2 protein, partial [Clostridia bacterium]|nr:glycoside hydrolase family 2 protein [Clostridia bacterium]